MAGDKAIHGFAADQQRPGGSIPAIDDRNRRRAGVLGCQLESPVQAIGSGADVDGHGIEQFILFFELADLVAGSFQGGKGSIIAAGIGCREAAAPGIAAIGGDMEIQGAGRYRTQQGASQHCRQGLFDQVKQGFHLDFLWKSFWLS